MALLATWKIKTLASFVKFVLNGLTEESTLKKALVYGRQCVFLSARIKSESQNVDPPPLHPPEKRLSGELSLSCVFRVGFSCRCPRLYDR